MASLPKEKSKSDTRQIITPAREYHRKIHIQMIPVTRIIPSIQMIGIHDTPEMITLFTMIQTPITSLQARLKKGTAVNQQNPMPQVREKNWVMVVMKVIAAMAMMVDTKDTRIIMSIIQDPFL